VAARLEAPAFAGGATGKIVLASAVDVATVP
jgi:hypothetical protein